MGVDSYDWEWVSLWFKFDKEKLYGWQIILMISLYIFCMTRDVGHRNVFLKKKLRNSFTLLVGALISCDHAALVVYFKKILKYATW